MNTQTNHPRVGLMCLLIILACPVLLFRWTLFPSASPPRLAPEVKDLCVLFSEDDTRPTLVCASSKRTLISTGIAKGIVPSICNWGDLPSKVEPCQILRVSGSRGGCSLTPVGKVQGAARLLCGGKIKINEARREELVLLPSIGPSRAEGIIEHRERKGAFESPEALEEISGIGEKTVASFLPWVEF